MLQYCINTSRMWSRMRCTTNEKMHLWWSLHTMYWLACQVTVAIGISGICCGIHVTSFKLCLLSILSAKSNLAGSVHASDTPPQSGGRVDRRAPGQTAQTVRGRGAAEELPSHSRVCGSHQRHASALPHLRAHLPESVRHQERQHRGQEATLAGRPCLVRRLLVSVAC